MNRRAAPAVMLACGLLFACEKPAPKSEGGGMEALEQAAGHTLASRPCGQRPVDLAHERSGKAGDLTWFVQLGRNGARGDEQDDRIFICTAKLIGARTPAMIVTYLDAGDGNGMTLVKEDFSAPVTSTSTLSAGQADTITVQTDEEGGVSHHSDNPGEEFDCDEAKGCTLTMTGGFLPPEKLSGAKLHVSFSNATGEIGRANVGLDGGFDAAYAKAETAWEALRPQPKAQPEPAPEPEPAAPEPAPDTAPPPQAPAPAPVPEAAAPSEPAPVVAAKASFPCTGSGPSGRRIVCSDAELARRDVALASLYRKARAAAADERAVEADQQEFVARRDACTTRGCIEQAYAERRRELIEFTGQ